MQELMGCQVIIRDGYTEDRLKIRNNPTIKRIPKSWQVYVKHDDNEVLRWDGKLIMTSKAWRQIKETA